MPRILNDWLSSYLEYVEETEPPTIFHRWCGVSAIAAALQRKVFLELGFNTFYPNLYIVLVAPPAAARKGTAMKEAKSIMRSVGLKMAPDTGTREGFIQELMGAQADASLSDEQLYVHSSVTFYNEELIQLFSHKSIELIKALTIWFDCEPTYTYRTIGRETEQIIGPWVNLLGAMTPSGVLTTFPNGDAFGGGLASRIVFIYADKKKQDNPLPALSAEKQTLKGHLIRDLEAISTLSGPFYPTDEMIEAYSAWYINSENNPPFTNPQLLGYNNRRQTHLLKLCLVLTASQTEKIGGSLRTCRTITSKIFGRAVEMLEKAEERMEETFQGYGSAKYAQIQHAIAEMIKIRGNVLQSEVLQTFRRDFDRVKDLEDIIDLLLAAKLIKRVTLHNDARLEWRG